MKKTALYDNHLKLGAKIVEFAGYAMPIQYEGIKSEHLFVRSEAGLFDVSHMGQAILEGAGSTELVEKLTPSSFANLSHGKAKYTVLLNDDDGIIDDLIITRLEDEKYFLVYNAGCKTKDEDHIKSKLFGQNFTILNDKSLIALQGQKAEDILQKIFPDANLTNQEYMSTQILDDIFISRLGYTGEDGFEISIPSEKAPKLWDDIISAGAKPIGLGARDSLRLEVGYPLYGHDIDDETTPIEANLFWIMPKDKRSNFRKEKLRVSVEITDKGIPREGAKIFSIDGSEIGVITSGGFSPSLNKSIAQGYVPLEFAESGTELKVELRGKMLNAKTTKLNFIEPKTKK